MNPWRVICQQLLRSSSPQTARQSRAIGPSRCWNTARASNHQRFSTDSRASSIYSRSIRKSRNTGRSQHLQEAFAQPLRHFSATARAAHGHIEPPKPGEEINVTFIDKDGEKHDFQVAKGDNLLDIAQANDLEMEGQCGFSRHANDHVPLTLTILGACGGSCACSTCHVIVEDQDMYDKMPEPDDDENDMLDLAFGLTETSRLGCQVKMTPELDGLVVRLPSMTRNLQASDFAEKK
ncbi:mitochondrial matrix iron-sulfur protein [Emydomyces testavorans]|uniref:Mitochondrial matrix iron-sulfur protein n=1 Tax=Emydomyces testavorans TaxID=2070801 RepID=A0AAF0DD41_9EURO|nr:mitochondrial matrix iron-sulfur protein [Emydomyces testavorans]